MTNVTVLQDWVTELPFQQQSVLMSALRGPDGIGKSHPVKGVVRAYRASVLKQAYLGKAQAQDGESDGFMDIRLMYPQQIAGYLNLVHTTWSDYVDDYHKYVDELPHHYHLHMLHAAEIAGRHHSDHHIRGCWLNFYKLFTDDMHLTIETKDQMNNRLNDFGASPYGRNGHGH